MTTRRRDHSSKWIDKEETGKHNLASSTECSAPASYQYYPASKTGGATKDMMKKSLERRYPPPCGSWNTRAEAATHHVGSRKIVRSFTQPFALPSNIPNCRRTAQYPAPTSASSVVVQQVPRRTTSLGNSHHVDYDSECRSPPPGRKPHIRTHISPKPEPEYEVNCFKPPSTMESCPNCPTYDERGRNTYKTGKARMTGMRTEKPLPPLTPRTTAGEGSSGHLYYASRTSHPEIYESSSGALEMQYRRRQRKPDIPASNNGTQRRTPITDTSKSLAENDKEFLDINEVEEEITCPM